MNKDRFPGRRAAVLPGFAPAFFGFAGEPVAVLGEKKLAGLGNLDHSSARPMLYVEFRFKDNSIDPAPWWDKSDMKEVRG